MPEKVTSGQPMDSYATQSAPYAGSAGGNDPPATADDDFEHLTGSKGPEAVPMLSTANMNMQDMTKGGDSSVPVFGVDNMMQDMSGPGPR